MVSHLRGRQYDPTRPAAVRKMNHSDDDVDEEVVITHTQATEGRHDITTIGHECKQVLGYQLPLDESVFSSLRFLMNEQDEIDDDDTVTSSQSVANKNKK